MDYYCMAAVPRSALNELLFAAAMGGALLIFIFISLRRESNKLDDQVFAWVNQHTSKSNTRLMLFFTFLGKHHFLIPVNLALLAYFLITRNDEYALKIPVIALSSVMLMLILKRIFYRQRPANPLLQKVRGLSYPSGHALMSASFYGLLIHITWHNAPDKALMWLLIFFFLMLILVIGFSRVYLRVHYTSDVLAGYAIGLLWLLFCIYAWPSVSRVVA